jgi:protein-tyrosine phosphatase
LYRSGALDLLDDEDASNLARLGIKTIFDLRSDIEKQARPDRILSGVEYVGLDMISGPAQHTPGRIMNSLQDPSAAHAAFGDGRGVAMFLSHYREFVALPSARRALARVFTDIADERHLPALVHCMGGKDRTGWTAASLQLLLGVPDDAVMAHFLASNEQLQKSFNGFVADFVARGGDAEVIAEFLWSRPEYLEASLDEMRTSFGTIEGYFSEGLGLGAETIAALRARFIEG